MAHPKGGYKIDGKRVPGVTTIIGRFKDSGGLLWWAYGQGQANERGEIDSLYDKRDEAGELGTMVHEMVEAHIDGVAFDIKRLMMLTKEQATQVQSGFDAYITWESMTKIKLIDQEMELVSEEYRFGGCPDAIGEVNGKLSLVDWKTSNAVYPDYLIQLAAYKHLWELNHPDQPLDGGFHLCRFSKDFGDFSHHYYAELDMAWEQFKLFRKAYDIDKVLKKRAK